MKFMHLLCNRLLYFNINKLYNCYWLHW